ncbi:hypothetical protein V500_01594 [Pseudogymnoascus sp. VKM F-4518 (FW-2643)]|nr:hypothetical protein V500_01594 [Pseudogymnoascus sp. VKM F-4518 (FW-2643)]
MLKFRSLFKLSAYKEARATCAAIEDGLCLLVQLHNDLELLLIEQTCASTILEDVAARVKEVGEEVGKVPVAVVAASCVSGKKRKRGEGKEEEEETVTANFG